MPLIIPWWVLLSSGSAPVILIAGWALAASLQPAGYDPMVQSISSLAAAGAADSWVMAGALFLVGTCHLVTALGLRVAALPGRVALGCGGIAAIMVALSPEPYGGVSSRHVASAGIGFAVLAVWPVLAAARRRASSLDTAASADIADPLDTAGSAGYLDPLDAPDSAAPWALRSGTGYAVMAVMMALAAWFLFALHEHGAAGLAERVLTGTQSLWPFIVVVACVASRLRARVGAPVSAAAATTSVPMRQES